MKLSMPSRNSQGEIRRVVRYCNQARSRPPQGRSACARDGCPSARDWQEGPGTCSAKEPKDKEALDAGAEYAGLEEYVEKIKSGWTDIDIIIATPDVMGEVARRDAYLVRAVLCQTPRAARDVRRCKAVQEVKAGKIEYRVDKTGNIHASVGKCSYIIAEACRKHLCFLRKHFARNPTTAKGKYVKAIFFLDDGSERCG
jgi:ribosomal protein L1